MNDKPWYRTKKFYVTLSGILILFGAFIENEIAIAEFIMNVIGKIFGG